MVAVATGALIAVAFAGVAMADEIDILASSEIEAVVETTTPDESTEPVDDETGAPVDETGLVCILVPIADETDVVEAESAEPVTIEQALASGTIECSGTGNERSSEVAALPRFLAHSDEWAGAEKGAAISAWAKTHANQKFDDDAEEPVEGGEAESGDDAAKSDHGSSGRSEEAPGHSGSHPGNGKGH